ncbi:MAG: VWA domain-containing protein [Dysgonamonadaceae bacterium]|jgi:hypothetical protein|nr:VWA domain-containing protein [Dysgonamonadaceae bacterium]
MKKIDLFKKSVLRNAFRAAFIIAAATVSLSICQSCDKIDDDFIDIPDDSEATLPPEIGVPTTNIPNFQYSVKKQSGNAIVSLEMTGIQNPETQQFLSLVGTSSAGQNIWVTIDGKPKGIAVQNNNSSSQKTSAMKADLVFLVDNSGSMGEEADSVASGIVNWAKNLANSGLDLKFGCVGYGYSYDEIAGAVNLSDVSTLNDYLNNRKSITSGRKRTYGFFGKDSAALDNAADKYSSGGECGAMALRYADDNFTYRAGANRIYVNFTDEPNQPGATSGQVKADYSVEFYKDASNWGTSSGTVHTVFSQDTAYYSYYWAEPSAYYERPWRMSEYTGGTFIIAPDDFKGVTLDVLPVSGAMQNYSIISFRADDLIGKSCNVTITVTDGNATRAERTFPIVFSN